ncbi:MFS transporter [Streptomyces sp. NPDC002767]
MALGPLSLSAKWYGVILACGSVFGIICAMVTPKLADRFERRPLQIGALVISGASVLLLAAVPSPLTLALSWGCAGATFSIWNVLSLTLRQRVVPSGMLARVNSANRSLSFAAIPLGTLCGGLISQIGGVVAPVWVAGIALTVLASIFALFTADSKP